MHFRVCPRCKLTALSGDYCAGCGHRLDKQFVRIPPYVPMLAIAIVLLGVALGFALAAAGLLRAPEIIVPQAHEATSLTLIAPPQATADEAFTVTVRARSNNEPLEGAVVRIGDDLFGLTDTNGEATITLVLPQGVQPLTATYVGDETYAPAQASAIVAVTQRTLQQLITSLQPSVVYITHITGRGSGVIIEHANNTTIVLTNRHVVGTESVLLVQTASGTVRPKEVHFAPTELDLAVLVLPGTLGVPAALEKKEYVQGESVVAIGSPLGLQGAVSAGIVSNVLHTDDYTLLQTDTAINPGNSGGGLFRTGTGELLGITTAKARSAEGIGFAIGLRTLDLLPPYTEWNLE